MSIVKNVKDKHLSLRINSELQYKLHYISQYEGRSANRQMIHLIRQCASEFEKTNGKIELPK